MHCYSCFALVTIRGVIVWKEHLPVVVLLITHYNYYSTLLECNLDALHYWKENGIEMGYSKQLLEYKRSIMIIMHTWEQLRLNVCSA